MRSLRVLLALVSTVALTACLNSTTLIKLQADGSGTVEQTTLMNVAALKSFAPGADKPIGGVNQADLERTATRMGKGYDAQLVERIQQACGKPATTAATAMLCAMAAYNIKKVVIAAPWSTATNVWVKAFLEDHGVEVLQHKALEVTRNNDIGRMPAQTAYDLGLDTDLPQADAVFLACGNWWTASIVADLEAKVQKPVLTTNNVALWASLQMMGVREKVSGFGRLLSEMPPLTHHEIATV